MNNQNNSLDSSLLLGTLLNITGISPGLIEAIINRNIIISKKPEEIKNFIFSNASFPETFLKRLLNLNVPLSHFNKIWTTYFGIKSNPSQLQSLNLQDLSSVTLENLRNYINHNQLNINQTIFSLKQNKNIRRTFIYYLDIYPDNKFTATQLANLFQVSRSTIESDRKYLKKNYQNK